MSEAPERIFISKSSNYNLYDDYNGFEDSIQYIRKDLADKEKQELIDCLQHVFEAAQPLLDSMTLEEIGNYRVFQHTILRSEELLSKHK